MAFNGELLEIFSKLPAKFLFKISPTCSTVCEYLSEEFFMRKQANNMLAVHGDTDLLIEPIVMPGVRNLNLEARPLFEEDGCHSIPTESLDFLLDQTRILASSNGVLCCQMLIGNKERLLLFNPTTRLCSNPIVIPEEAVSGNGNFTVFFACEENEYLLMTLVHPNGWTGPYSLKIYSPEQNIWRDCDRFNAGDRCICEKDNYVYSNGVLYMISDTGDNLREGSRWYWPYIVACEIKGSKISSSFLTIPEDAKPEVHGSKLRIFTWGSPRDEEYNKSICLVKLLRNMFTVWKLLSSDDNGTEWTQIFEMHIDNEFTDDFMIEEFKVVNGRFLLFVIENMVYRYDLQKGATADHELIEEVCGHELGNYRVRIIPFSSTLRPTC